MPVAPTERLVVTGFNRFVRNPMYIGLLTAILGQALLFDSPWLVLYAVIGWIATASFVHWYEEPTLVRTFGEQYKEYRRNVPAWTPRLTPWNPAPQNGGGSESAASQARRCRSSSAMRSVRSRCSALMRPRRFPQRWAALGVDRRFGWRSRGVCSSLRLLI